MVNGKGSDGHEVLIKLNSVLGIESLLSRISYQDYANTKIVPVAHLESHDELRNIEVRTGSEQSD